jgi:hypothetical protein
MPNMMPRKLRDAWIAKMRDPNTKQIQGSYFEYEGDNSLHTAPVRTNCGCAMGLLYIVAAEMYDKSPHQMASTLGQRTVLGHSLDGCYAPANGLPGSCDEIHSIMVNLNDNQQWPLRAIADWVEQNVPYS